MSTIIENFTNVFRVDFHDGRRRVWRMPGERYADCSVTEHDRFRGGSVMIWAGISIDGKTDLHVIAGNLSGVRYRDEILHPIVRPCVGAVCDGFILMDDNARPHRARVVTDYLENETIKRMEWPSIPAQTITEPPLKRSCSVTRQSA
jgi:hypothetical protein